MRGHNMIYPVSTEKAINLISKRNTLTFIVDKDASKEQIKKEVERLYEVRVESVNIMHTFQGKKKAMVKLAKESNAMDVASKLKII
ncbi:MAG: 50S ribosomal protein L23 [Candidatus Micrarchaeia archaeon]